MIQLPVHGQPEKSLMKFPHVSYFGGEKFLADTAQTRDNPLGRVPIVLATLYQDSFKVQGTPVNFIIWPSPFPLQVHGKSPAEC